VKTAVTCDAPGVEERTCPNNASPAETRQITQLAWEWRVTTPATPTTVGVETKTCPNGTLDGTRPLLPKCDGVAYDPVATKTFCDSRENKLYKFAVIGTQTWMAENLNYAVGGKCYAEGVDGVSADSIAKNCATYGRLYDWSTAMDIDSRYNSEVWGGSDVKHRGVCPSGWHLPSDAEWDALMTAIGGSSTASKHLKAKEGWNSCGPSGSGKDYLCEDTNGFSALPGGDGNSDGSFSNVGNYGLWWSSTEYDSYYAYLRGMLYYRNDVVSGWNGKSSLLQSVRCVKD